jgi:hypothetical protein
MEILLLQSVYRATDTGSSLSYQKVSNVTIVTWHGDQIIRSPAFNCYNVSINEFPINVGDIVAACVYDPGGRFGSIRQLDIVGRTNGHSLMRMNDESDCIIAITFVIHPHSESDSLPTNVLSSRLLNIDSRILHVYATITGMLRVSLFC